jgi:enoyl-CoA hydratase/carnithine racemase
MSDLLFDRHGKVAVITLNRPDDGNRWRHEMLLEFEDIVAALERDDTTHAVIVTAAGHQHFSLGTFNIAIRGAMPKEKVVEMVLRGNRLRDAIEKLPQITIAAINGTALGGAVEMTLTCDMRLTADHATLAFPEGDMGGFPGGGGPSRLPTAVGRARALEWICTGREVNAAEMVRTGFALGAHPSADLMSEAMKLAHTIAEKGPLATRGAKRIVHARLEPGLRESRELADQLRAQLEYSEDVTEAYQAFMQNRKPVFTGR